MLYLDKNRLESFSATSREDTEGNFKGDRTDPLIKKKTFSVSSRLFFKHPVLKYIVLAGSAREGLKSLDFMISPPCNISSQNDPFLASVASELKRYLDGEIVDFGKIRLAMNGTIFEQKVWSVLRNIPLGYTQSYGWVARQIGQPNASRAVGQANGKNPIPIIVPCHRVIRSDGSIGGYSGGLHIKRFLLSLEKIKLTY